MSNDFEPSGNIKWNLRRALRGFTSEEFKQEMEEFSKLSKETQEKMKEQTNKKLDKAYKKGNKKKKKVKPDINTCRDAVVMGIGGYHNPCNGLKDNTSIKF